MMVSKSERVSPAVILSDILRFTHSLLLIQSDHTELSLLPLPLPWFFFFSAKSTSDIALFTVAVPCMSFGTADCFFHKALAEIPLNRLESQLKKKKKKKIEKKNPRKRNHRRMDKKWRWRQGCVAPRPLKGFMPRDY